MGQEAKINTYVEDLNRPNLKKKYRKNLFYFPGNESKEEKSFSGTIK